MDIENLGKKSGVIDGSINNRIQEMEGISGAEDTRESTDTTKYKIQKAPNPKHPGNPVHNNKTKPKGNR